MLGIFLSCYKCSPAPAAPGLGIPPAWPLEHGPGNPGSLSRLRDKADTFIFAGSSSSKTDSISQRHTDTRGHTHSQRTQTELVTKRATDKILPQQPPHSGLTAGTGDTGTHLFLLLGCRGRRSLVQDTHHTAQVLGITEWLGLEGTSGDLLKQGYLTAGGIGSCPGRF